MILIQNVYEPISLDKSAGFCCNSENKKKHANITWAKYCTFFVL